MGGRLRLLFVSHVFSSGTLPKIGGTSSSKFSLFFFTVFLRCEHVRVHGWTNGRTDGWLAGDMSILLTLITSTVFSLSSSLYIPLPPNQSTQPIFILSIIDDHIIQHPYPSHPEIPTSKERLERSGFFTSRHPCCIANVFITSF